MKLNIPILALLTGPLSAAVLVDDFSAGLTNFSNTVILNNGTPTFNTSSFVVNSSDELQLTTTAYENIEQYAFIYTGAFVDIGEEAQLDIAIPLSGSRNFGLYVGGTAPTTAPNSTNVREDFISVYGSSTAANNVATRGFDGNSEYGNTQTTATGAQTLFIARTAVNTFEIGFYDSTATRTVFETRTPTTANSADFVGIYADARAAGTVGAASEFRIISAVPEPSTALLGALGALGLLRRRRA